MIVSKLRSVSLNNVLLRKAMVRYMSSAHAGHEPNPDLWRKLFLFVCIPAIALAGINTYLLEKEHLGHYHRPEFKPYEYMYVRTKPFPWRDGQKSLFHNPRFNPLPTGWEELPEEADKKH